MEIDTEEARRHGERWAQVAIAAFIRESLAQLPSEIFEASAFAYIRDLADRIGDGSWRRPEMKSIVEPGEL